MSARQKSREAGADARAAKSLLPERERGGAIKILDIGCGRHKVPGAIGLDFNPRTDADIIHNLSSIPYPFADNEFDLIIGNQVIEHIENVPALMSELYRIAKLGALIRFDTPHFTDVSSFRDPTHRHHFTCESFIYFTEKRPEFEFYSDVSMRTRVIRVRLLKLWRLMGLEILINSCNRYPQLRFLRRFWESYLCFIIRGKTIFFEFEVLK